MSADPARAPAGLGAAEAHDFYQEGLTGLRALAATWVMLFHIVGFAGPRAIVVALGPLELKLHPLLTCGWVGVDLFFVLSGFLLTTHLMGSMARAQPGLYRRYFLARIRRVVPAYWAQLAILVGVALVVTGSMPAWIRYVPLHLPMLHFVSESASWAINGVYWTLPIEFGFYLCLPFIVRMLVRAERSPGSARWVTLALLCAGALALTWTYRYFAWRAFAASPTNTIVWAVSQLPGSLDVFMAGVAAAAVLRWRRLRPGESTRTLSTALAVAGLGGVIAMIYWVDAIYLEFWRGHLALFVWHSINAAFAALLVAGIALGGGLTRVLFENRVAVWLGTISYSTYLWHYPILQWLKPWLDAAKVGLAGYLAIAIALTTVVAAISYYAIEKPFLKKR